MMVGRSLNQRFPDKENKPGEVILEVRNLTALRQPSIRDVGNCRQSLSYCPTRFRP